LCVWFEVLYTFVSCFLWHKTASTPSEIISNRVCGIWLGIGEGANIIIISKYVIQLDSRLLPLFNWSVLLWTVLIPLHRSWHKLTFLCWSAVKQSNNFCILLFLLQCFSTAISCQSQETFFLYYIMIQDIFISSGNCSVDYGEVMMQSFNLGPLCLRRFANVSRFVTVWPLIWKLMWNWTLCTTSFVTVKRCWVFQQLHCFFSSLISSLFACTIFYEVFHLVLTYILYLVQTKYCSLMYVLTHIY